MGLISPSRLQRVRLLTVRDLALRCTKASDAVALWSKKSICRPACDLNCWIADSDRLLILIRSAPLPKICSSEVLPKVTLNQ